jgi:hypothetical protein
MGHFVFKSRIRNINRSADIKEKLKKYLTAFLVRCSLVELGGVFGALAAFLTGNLFFLAAPLVAIIILLIWRPGLGTIAEDLNLTSEERSILQDPNAIVAEGPGA